MAGNGTGAGHDAGLAQVWTWGCCWLKEGGHPHLQGAPVRETGGAWRVGRAPQRTRKDQSLCCSHCCLRSHCWLRLAGVPGERWDHWVTQGSWAGLCSCFPARQCSQGHCSAAVWHSHHCCTASWRPESKPWSHQGAMEIGSVPAPLALTRTGSDAWLVVLLVALCSHRGPRCCPRPGPRMDLVTLASRDPWCELHHTAGKGKQGLLPPGFQQAVSHARLSRGSCLLKKHKGAEKRQVSSGSIE
jgi:hypothetical protein